MPQLKGQSARRTLSALALTLVLIGTAIPLALGGLAQRTYQDLLGATLDALPTGWVILEHYDRGWFSSSASTELALQPPAGGPPGAALQRIRIDSRIEQGPRAWFSGPGFPVLAQVQTRVEWADSPVRLPALLMTTNLATDGGAQARLQVPALDQPGQTDGYRLRSSDLSGTVRVRPELREISIDLHLPGMELVAPAGPLASLTNARLKADLKGWIGDLYTGNARLELGSARLGGTPGPNPDATLLEGVAMHWEQAPSGKTLDLRLDVLAESLRLGTRDYRTAAVGLSAQSLDGRALADIAGALRALTSDTYSQALRGMVGLTLLTRVLPRLLAAGPRLSLDPFTLTTPDGPIAAQLSLTAPPQPGAASSPYRDPATWISALAGEGKLELPEPIARDWLDRASGTARPTPRERLRTWIDSGWVAADQGRVSSRFQLADGQLTVNGRPVSLLGPGWRELQ